MSINENTYNEIVQLLKPLDPYRIILFGSRANNKRYSESDIDLTVVLDESIIPADYSEKMSRKLKVRRAIYDLSQRYQIDLVTYTRGEYESIQAMKTSFINELAVEGIVLYEKAG